MYCVTWHVLIRAGYVADLEATIRALKDEIATLSGSKAGSRPDVREENARLQAQTRADLQEINDLRTKLGMPQKTSAQATGAGSLGLMPGAGAKGSAGGSEWDKQSKHEA
jgi:hypothetical protein